MCMRGVRRQGGVGAQNCTFFAFERTSLLTRSLAHSLRSDEWPLHD